MIRILRCGILISLVSGCAYRQGFYLSPLNANTNAYHAIPMKKDSLKSAIYTTAVLTTGSANDRAADHIIAFQGSMHRSNNFSIFQAFYGANLTLGSYHMEEYYNWYHNGYGGGGYPYMDSLNHIPNASKFFGSYGVSGGINIVVPHRHKTRNRYSEWRALGLETSLQNEFGKYQQWRNKLIDTSANIIYRNHFSAYLGLYTEWVWTKRNGTEFGMKMAVGEDLMAGSNYSTYFAPSVLPLYCFSVAFHVKKDRYTGFIQTNFGTYADNIQFGLSYRLGKK
jgi:hypothetical protein